MVIPPPKMGGGSDHPILPSTFRRAQFWTPPKSDKNIWDGLFRSKITQNCSGHLTHLTHSRLEFFNLFSKNKLEWYTLVIFHICVILFCVFSLQVLRAITQAIFILFGNSSRRGVVAPPTSLPPGSRGVVGPLHNPLPTFVSIKPHIENVNAQMNTLVRLWAA